MKNKTKNSSFLYEHRFAIWFFIYTAVYNFLVVTRLKFWQTDSSGTYMHHIIDYKSLGFRSGLLPGSIFYGIFGEHATPLVASVYETVLILLFFIGVAALLEKLVYSVNNENRMSAVFLILVFLSGPFTFAVFTDTLGMLDVYFLFLALIFFFVIENKALRILIPVLYMLSLLVHFSAVMTCVVLFSILILYRMSIDEERKNRKTYLAVFIVSMVVTAALGVFLAVTSGKMPITVKEFNDMVESRGGTYFAYYDYTLFDYNIFEDKPLYPAELYAIESPVIRALSLAFAKIRFLYTEYVELYMTNRIERIFRWAVSIVVLAPPMCIYYRTIGRLFKNEKENKLKKFSLFLMMVQFPFTVAAGMLFSLDIIRWFTHAFLISFTMLLYVMYKEGDVRTQVLKSVEKVRSVPATWVYLLAYAVVNFSAYT